MFSYNPYVSMIYTIEKWWLIANDKVRSDSVFIIIQRRKYKTYQLFFYRSPREQQQWQQLMQQQRSRSRSLRGQADIVMYRNLNLVLSWLSAFFFSLLPVLGHLFQHYLWLLIWCFKFILKMLSNSSLNKAYMSIHRRIQW